MGEPGDLLSKTVFLVWIKNREGSPNIREGLSKYCVARTYTRNIRFLQAKKVSLKKTGRVGELGEDLSEAPKTHPSDTG